MKHLETDEAVQDETCVTSLLTMSVTELFSARWGLWQDGLIQVAALENSRFVGTLSSLDPRVPCLLAFVAQKRRVKCVLRRVEKL